MVHLDKAVDIDADLVEGQIHRDDTHVIRRRAQHTACADHWHSLLIGVRVCKSYIHPRQSVAKPLRLCHIRLCCAIIPCRERLSAHDDGHIADLHARRRACCPEVKLHARIRIIIIRHGKIIGKRLLLRRQADRRILKITLILPVRCRHTDLHCPVCVRVSVKTDCVDCILFQRNVRLYKLYAVIHRAFICDLNNCLTLCNLRLGIPLERGKKHPVLVICQALRNRKISIP